MSERRIFSYMRFDARYYAGGYRYAWFYGGKRDSGEVS